ncbi:putative DNA primase, partial [Pseudomonas cannabina]
MTLTIDHAKKLVIEFCATYPVASTISYKIRETQEELYGPQATREAAGTILGSFRPGRGRAEFAISNFRDEDHFRRTLRHEVLGHYGINTFNPAEKRAVLEGVIQSRNDPGMAALWAEVARIYPQLTDSMKAEEVFAFACERIVSPIRGNVAEGARSFRETCIERTRAMQVSDLINLTTMVAEGLHDRSRSQQNFPASDNAQFKIETAPRTSEYPVWLAVPPDDRDKARLSAGRLSDGRAAIAWNKEEKLWFARPGCDLDRITAWLPDPSRRAGGGDAESEFLDVLTQAGLVVKGMPVMDGSRQRVATVDDKHGKKSGVYCGFLDRRPAGWFINYHRADSPKDVTNWAATGGESDPITRLHIRAGAKQAQEDAARDRAVTYAKQTLAAKRLYDRLPAADPAHPYLVRKGIPPTPDIRQTRNGALVVPFFNASGTFKTLQYIPPEGEKFLFKDAPKQEHFLVVGGPLDPVNPILYAEGYATARSLNLATGLPVVMT